MIYNKLTEIHCVSCGNRPVAIATEGNVPETRRLLNLQHGGHELVNKVYRPKTNLGVRLATDLVAGAGGSWIYRKPTPT